MDTAYVYTVGGRLVTPAPSPVPITPLDRWPAYIRCPLSTTSFGRTKIGRAPGSESRSGRE
jgi:hypothetical protein